MTPLEFFAKREFDRRTVTGFGLLIAACVIAIFVATLLAKLLAPVADPIRDMIPEEIRAMLVPVLVITGASVTLLVGAVKASQHRARARIIKAAGTEGWTLDVVLGSFSKFWGASHEHLRDTWVRLVRSATRAFLVVPADTRIFGPREWWGRLTRIKFRTRPGERNAGPAQALATEEQSALGRGIRKLAAGGKEPNVAFVTLGCGEGFTGLTRAIVLAKEILGIRPRLLVLTIVIDRSQLRAAPTGASVSAPTPGPADTPIVPSRVSKQPSMS